MSYLYSHFVLIVSIIWKIWFALFAYYYFGSPDSAKAASLDQEWVLSILTRDVLVTWCVGGAWDFLHLHPWSPFFTKLQAFKFKPEFPALSVQIPHDFVWATES